MKVIKLLLNYEVSFPMLQLPFFPPVFPSSLGCISLFCYLLNLRVNNQLPYASLHPIHFRYDFFLHILSQSLFVLKCIIALCHLPLHFPQVSISCSSLFYLHFLCGFLFLSNTIFPLGSAVFLQLFLQSVSES